MIPVESTTDATLHQAAAHYRAGRLAEAELLYRQVLARQWNRADVHDGLALMLFLQGRTSQAAAAFRVALEIEPERTETLYKLGNLLLRECDGSPERVN